MSPVKKHSIPVGFFVGIWVGDKEGFLVGENVFPSKKKLMFTCINKM